ncbi:uncharacterized protein LOC117898721 [Drosophila subobscura]|uniref:uncharacterized protein LOC117898721 n=1 Tax=Drosophila subobscura TaxID=7241 RepID=UPI00155AE9FA|nr:uncharacterized protein LOC117898721 [Drosophila subobscura]
MRLYCKMSHILNITRCISYHSPVLRPRFLLNERARRLKRIGYQAMPCPVQLYSQSATNKVFTFNGRVNMLRKRISFSGSPGGTPDGSRNVIPIGLITPEKQDGKDLKIVIVPLDIAGMDANELQETLKSINQLRKYANEIDAFSSSMVDDFNAMMREANSEAAQIKELPAAGAQTKELPAAGAQTKELPAAEEQQPVAAEHAEFWQSYTTTPSTADTDIDAIASGRTNLEAPPLEQRAMTGSVLDSNLTTSSLPTTTTRLPTTTQPKVQTQDQAKAHTQAKVQLQPEEPQDKGPAQPQPLPKTLPIQDPVQAQPQGTENQLSAAEPEATGEDLQGVMISVPRTLSDRLNDLAISSMELSFEMDMTNVRDAIECKQTGGQALMPNNPVVSMNTRVELATPVMPDHTVPLRFNALIAGVVNVDMKKLDLESMTEDQVPDFNDDVTSLAANLCSAALENGLCPDQNAFQQATGAAPMIEDTPMELSDKELSEMTDQELSALKHQYAARLSELQSELCAVEQMDPAMTVAAIAKSLTHERELPQISTQARAALNRNQSQKHMKQTTGAAATPTQVMSTAEPQEEFQGPFLRDGCKHGVIKPKKKCKKKCPLDDPCKEDKCKRPKKGDKKSPRKKASLDASQIRASGGKSSGGGKKASPCGKKGGKGDSKDKKKKDPCAKKDGGKKKDPCAKKDDKKKKDPCAKFKSGEKKDPCAKKDDKKKKDPCAKFKTGEKKDPFGKKDDQKKSPCAKKRDRFGKKDEQKKDPCAKKAGKADKKKKDPCAKFKKSPKKEINKNKNKCGKKGGNDKKKTDPCKKKYSTFRAPFPYRNTPKWQNRQAAGAKSPVRESSHAAATPTPCPCRYLIYSTLVRRHYGGKPTKTQLCGLATGDVTTWQRGYAKGKKEDGGKCSGLEQKFPLNRGKDKKARTKPRTDCYIDGEECPKKWCTGTCASVKFPRKKCDKSKKKKRSGKKSKPTTEGSKLLSPQPFAALALAHWQRRKFSCQPQTELGDNRSRYMINIPRRYDIEMLALPLAKPKEYEAIIRVGSVALSGSDIHIYENGNEHMKDMTLGHEATGFVEQLGSCVQNLKLGDRVACEATITCGFCDLCKEGRYQMCEHLWYKGFLGTHQVHHADLCHRLPENITMEEGSLIPTLAAACAACLKGEILPLSNVLVIGSGASVIAAGLVAKCLNAKQVTLATSMNATREMASTEFGLNCVQFDSGSRYNEVLESIYSQGRGWPNLVINFAISELTMNLAIMALKPCGICVLAECASEVASFNTVDLLMKNIKLRPSFRYANMYPLALQLMSSRLAPLRKLIGKAYAITRVDEAFQEAQRESNTGIRKVIVNCSESDTGRRTLRRRRLDKT